MTIRAPQSQETHKLSNLKRDTADGANLRATRAHGNYTENAPLFGLMLLVADLMGVISPKVVDVMGFMFATGRFLHALGMYSSEGTSVGRMLGAILTLSSLVGISALCLISAYVMNGGLGAVRCSSLFISFAISLGVAAIVPGVKTKE